MIAHHGERVSIDVKVASSLQHDHVFLAEGPSDLAALKSILLAFVEPFQRHVRVKQMVVDGELWGASAVIHTRSSALSLIRRAQESAARGAIEVTEQLQRLRDQGKIDEHGNILVPWPEDMKPGSTTDL